MSRHSDREERLQRLAGMHLYTGSDGVVPWPYISAADAARQLGVSTRTIERDKVELARRGRLRAAREAPTRAHVTRERARTSDIPRSCLCTWRYNFAVSRWQRTGAVPFCPWHASRQAAS